MVVEYADVAASRLAKHKRSGCVLRVYSFTYCAERKTGSWTHDVVVFALDANLVVIQAVGTTRIETVIYEFLWSSISQAFSRHIVYKATRSSVKLSEIVCSEAFAEWIRSEAVDTVLGCASCYCQRRRCCCLYTKAWQIVLITRFSCAVLDVVKGLAALTYFEILLAVFTIRVFARYGYLILCIKTDSKRHVGYQIAKISGLI